MISSLKIVAKALFLTLFSLALCVSTSTRADEGAFFDIGEVVLPSSGLSEDELALLSEVGDVVEVLRSEKDYRDVFKRWNNVADKALSVHAFKRENLPQEDDFNRVWDEYFEYRRSLDLKQERIFGVEITKKNCLSVRVPGFSYIYVLTREVFGDLVVLANSNGCIELEIAADAANRPGAISKITLYRFDNPDVVELSYDRNRAPRRYVETRFAPGLTFYDITTRNDLDALANAARRGELNPIVKELLGDVKSVERKTIRVVEWNDEGQVARDERPETDFATVAFEFAPDEDAAESAPFPDGAGAAFCEDTTEKSERLAAFGRELVQRVGLDRLAATLKKNETGIEFNSLRLSSFGPIVAFNDKYQARFKGSPKYVDDILDESNVFLLESDIEAFGSKTFLETIYHARKPGNVFVRNYKRRVERPVVAQSRVFRALHDETLWKQFNEESAEIGVVQSSLLDYYLTQDGSVDVERRYIPFSNQESEAPAREPIFDFPIVTVPEEGLLRNETYFLKSLATFTCELSNGAGIDELATFSGFDPFADMTWLTNLPFSGVGYRSISGSSLSLQGARLNFRFAYSSDSPKPTETTLVKGALVLTLASRDGGYTATLRYPPFTPTRVGERPEVVVFEFDSNGVLRSLSYRVPNLSSDATESSDDLAKLVLGNPFFNYDAPEFKNDDFLRLQKIFNLRLGDFPELRGELYFRAPRTSFTKRRVVWDDGGRVVTTEKYNNDREDLHFAPLSYSEPIRNVSGAVTPNLLTPTPRYFPKRDDASIFKNLPEIKTSSTKLPPNDLAVADALTRLVAVVSQPTRLEELKGALDQFPTNEIFGESVDGAARTTEIAIDYDGVSSKKPARLSYTTASGRVALEFVDDDLYISALNGNGVDGATLKVDASGAIADYFVHKRRKACYNDAFDEALKALDPPPDDQKIADLKKRFSKALASVGLENFAASFRNSEGELVDVVRRFGKTDAQRGEKDK